MHIWEGDFFFYDSLIGNDCLDAEFKGKGGFYIKYRIVKIEKSKR